MTARDRFGSPSRTIFILDKLVKSPVNDGQFAAVELDLHRSYHEPEVTVDLTEIMPVPWPLRITLLPTIPVDPSPNAGDEIKATTVTVVNTPLGPELVPEHECTDPTVELDPFGLQQLLEDSQVTFEFDRTCPPPLPGTCQSPTPVSSPEPEVA